MLAADGHEEAPQQELRRLRVAEQRLRDEMHDQLGGREIEAIETDLRMVEAQKLSVKSKMSQRSKRKYLLF